MNPYYYFFYRLSNFFNKNKTNEWGPIFGISIFPGWNIGILYRLILPITKENFDGFYKITLILILATLFITNSILFLNKNRVSRIIQQYSKESQAIRRIRGYIVILYIILSIGLIVLI